MNQTYRIIWSESQQAFVVASELARGKGKGSSRRKVVAAAVASALLTLEAGRPVPRQMAPG